MSKISLVHVSVELVEEDGVISVVCTESVPSLPFPPLVEKFQIVSIGAALNEVHSVAESVKGLFGKK